MVRCICVRPALESAPTSSRAGLNYIKGFRYELFLAVRSARTTHCVAWVDASLPDALAENESRAAAAASAAPAPYPPAVLADLWSRFEVPDERVRWDDPLVRVSAPEGSGETRDAGGSGFSTRPDVALKQAASTAAASAEPPAAQAPPPQRKTVFKRTGVRVVLGAASGRAEGSAAATAAAALAVSVSVAPAAERRPDPAASHPSEGTSADNGAAAGDDARSAVSSGGFGSCDDIGSDAEADAAAAAAAAADASAVGRPHPGDAIGSVVGGRRQRQQERGGKGRSGDTGLPAFNEETYASAAAAALRPASADSAPLPAHFAAAAVSVARALFLRRAYKPSLAVKPEPSAPPHFIAALHSRVEAATAELEASVPAGEALVACRMRALPPLHSPFSLPSGSDSLPAGVPLAVAGSPVPLRLNRPLPVSVLRRLRAEVRGEEAAGGRPRLLRPRLPSSDRSSCGRRGHPLRALPPPPRASTPSRGDSLSTCSCTRPTSRGLPCCQLQTLRR